ncbi:hypothetical protein CDAR_301981 [Caerostris darwini]|uniref:Uncharacterized protein n=1 Tax=Caerostris darwini TaxID=1538125 RepID=A0AAV4UHC1_9ARAC|nr:hypothetical protein CDAR_301981 [Caerostris darwini]
MGIRGGDGPLAGLQGYSKKHYPNGHVTFLLSPTTFSFPHLQSFLFQIHFREEKEGVRGGGGPLAALQGTKR